MLSNDNVLKRTRVKVSKEEKYPNIGCLTISYTKSNKGKIIHLNDHAIKLLGLSWDDNGITKVAVVRGYDGNEIVIGSTVEESIKHSIDGTYKTVQVHYTSHNIQSTKMANIILEHFIIDMEEDDIVEVFLQDEVEENVYTIVNEIPSGEDVIEVDNGENVDITLETESVYHTDGKTI